MFIVSITNAESITCKDLFHQPEMQVAKTVGVSITYSPVLNINGQIRSFPDHFYLEVYRSGKSTPVSSRLLPYRSDALGSLPVGRDGLQEVGLKAIYQNYGDRVPLEIIQAVKSVEAALPMSRQAAFIARNDVTSDLITSVEGMIRVFDGSIYTDGVRAIDNPALPLEKILRKFNKSTDVVNQRRRLGFDVFEIGKYYLSERLKSENYDEVRKDILRWLLDYLDTRSEDMLSKSYFFAHVASRAHLRAYERFFGFRLEDRSKSQNLDASENILSIRGDELRSRLIELTK
jgi:hypothetical protein